MRLSQGSDSIKEKRKTKYAHAHAHAHAHAKKDRDREGGGQRAEKTDRKRQSPPPCLSLSGKAEKTERKRQSLREGDKDLFDLSFPLCLFRFSRQRQTGRGTLSFRSVFSEFKRETKREGGRVRQRDVLKKTHVLTRTLYCLFVLARDSHT